MERRTQPYSIQKRPTKRKNRYMFYVKFRDPETGDYGNAVSSGCTNRDDAVRWAEERSRSGLVGSKNPRFEDYVKGFWDLGGRYAQGRIAREKTISNGTLAIARGNTEKHLVPKWGQFRFQAISAGLVDSWILDLHKQRELDSQTINRLLGTFRVILSQATKDKIIPHNPAREVEPLKEHPRERGVFTMEELQKLFGSPDIWPDKVHMTINLLAACTGMRMGEIRGLGIGSIQAGRLSISRSWEQGYGFKEPKCGSSREIPLCSNLFDQTRWSGFTRARGPRPLDKSIRSSDHMQNRARFRGLMINAWSIGFCI